MSRAETVIVDYKDFNIKNFVICVPKAGVAKSDPTVKFFTLQLLYKEGGVHKTLILKSPPLESRSGIKQKEQKRGMQYKMAATLNRDNEEHMMYMQVLDDIYNAIIDNLLNNAATIQVCGSALAKLSDKNPETFMYNLYIKPTDSLTGKVIEDKDPMVSDLVKYFEDQKTGKVYTARFTNLLGDEEKWDTLRETGFEAYRYIKFDAVFIGATNLVRKQITKGVVTRLLERRVDEEAIKTRQEYISQHSDAVKEYTEKRAALEKAKELEMAAKRQQLTNAVKESKGASSKSDDEAGEEDEGDGEEADGDEGDASGDEDKENVKPSNKKAVPTEGTMAKVSGFGGRRRGAVKK